MVPVSPEGASVTLVGKEMFAQSKLATHDVLLMECVPMGLAFVPMVKLS